MAAFKNKDNGTWYVQFRYTDWRGERQQKLKRGFPTKKAALAWEREFLMKKQADLNMTLESFVELYTQDIKPKLKLNTWLTKECIIQKKILPYLGKRKLSEITPQDIFCWQNEIRKITDKQGKPLSTTYLKTIHNQMSAIFNHAVRYYGLQSNPAAKAGSMGEKEATEMQFWTKEEFLKVIDAMMDSPIHYYAFEMLYWCGLRIGELFALTPDDFNFETGTVTISKSYQRIKGDDVITCPKTKKSNLMMQDRLQIIKEIEAWRQRLMDFGTLDADIERQLEETQVVAELVKAAVKENASTAQSQEAYLKKYETLTKRYEMATTELERLQNLRTSRSQQDKKMALYIRTLKKQPEVMHEWNDIIWTVMIEKAIVHRNGEITFVFHNGTEIKVGA